MIEHLLREWMVHDWWGNNIAPPFVHRERLGPKFRPSDSAPFVNHEACTNATDGHETGPEPDFAASPPAESTGAPAESAGRGCGSMGFSVGSKEPWESYAWGLVWSVACGKGMALTSGSFSSFASFGSVPSFLL